MNKKTPKVITTDEADAFLRSLSVQAQKKIAFNIKKVEMGIIDSEVYKKLEGTYIWELRTLYNGICYRLFSF
ncbi:MAG: type II toxin-antitoxin system RelE/ParE family toxin, partial [Bacteroidales bacterium]|nr:type II toxin-antitoxin system RelE/ParE family toxin [Bacteroidales bacterium]